MTRYSTPNHDAKPWQPSKKEDTVNSQFTMARFSGKSYITINVLWYSLQLLSETFFILRLQRETTINIHSFHAIYQLLLSDFNKPCIFSTNFRKKTQISNSIKIRVVPRGRTDGHEEASSFANAPEKYVSYLLQVRTKVCVTKPPNLQLHYLLTFIKLAVSS